MFGKAMVKLRAVYEGAKLKMHSSLKEVQAGNANALVDLAVSAGVLVVVGVIIGAGVTILANYQSTQDANSAAFNATGKALEGLSNLSGQLPTIGLIVAAGAIITVLFGAFAFLLYRGMKQE